MSTFPQILMVPILSSLGSGDVSLPNVGVVLFWGLIAALVGSGLGILRQMSRKTPASVSARRPSEPKNAVALNALHQRAA